MEKNKKTTSGKTNLRYKLAGIFALFLVCLIVVFPSQTNRGVDLINSKINLGLPRLPEKGFNLGLDLQGGAHLTYKADLGGVKDSERSNAVEGVRDVIERRVRGGLGVSEPLVQTTRVGEEYRIIVELPGISDVKQAIAMIGETPVLDFKEQNSEVARTLTDKERKEMNDFNALANKKANEALIKAKNGVKFEDIVASYSEDDKSKNNGGNLGFVTETSYPEIYKWASAEKTGVISAKVVSTTEGLNILKKIGEKDGEQQIKVSHLLLCYRGATSCDNPVYSKKEAKDRIEKIKSEINASNFSDYVKQYTTEPGGKDNAGELGWIKKGQTVATFENAAFSLSKGSISDVVETDFGYHLIYKQDERTPKEFEVARILLKTKKESDILPPQEDWKKTGLSGKQLTRAEVVQNSQTGEVQVSLKFNKEGGDLFAEITKRNVGKPIAIFLDGTPITVPTVNVPILDGSAVIEGNFTFEEAQQLARRLNSGALPVPVELISQQTVDASLGSDSLAKSIKAGIIGFLAVIIFMICYYRLPGVLAVLALGIYTLLSLAIFKLIGVTLTLSGIAGFILSVGMAVDANVLIFERLKEELRWGKNLSSAMEESFIRSWTSIRDSNVTTLLSCVFLIWMGGGFVQGFAVTLAIGVLVSMFTAITITRNFMRLIAPWFPEFGNKLFLGHKKDNK